MRLRRRLWCALVAVPAIVAATAVPAFASHFRASNTSVSYANGVLTWQFNSAWRKDNVDQFISSAGNVAVTDSNGSAVAAAVVSEPVTQTDDSNPLYAIEHDTTTIDINALLGTPGTYQAYATKCCRVGGVQNTNGLNSFSQAISFTIRSNGTVDLPPRPDRPALYTLLPLGNAGLMLDYGATDPEGAAVTYAQMTTTGAPDFGATALPCSTFIGGILRLARSLCAAGDNFTTIYAADFFFAVKVRATDATGNHTEVDTLLRVPGVPEPYIDASTVDRGSAVFTVIANDTFVDTYSVTCTNTLDPLDVHTGQSSTSPVTVLGLRPDAAYGCVASATNGIGTGVDTSGATTVTTVHFTPQALTFPRPPNTHLAASHVTLTATASSGLAVTYTSATPSVCTVSGRVVTMRRAGTCSISAAQPGNETFGAALSVTRSFTVLPAAPTPPTRTSTGRPGAAQTVSLGHPIGGTVTLLDARGVATVNLVVARQGTYRLNSASGVLTFTPSAGFTGRATPVRYRISDAYGQSGVSTYTAVVSAPSNSATVTAAPLAVASSHHRVKVTCRLQSDRVRHCAVDLFATVHGHRVKVGHGAATGTASTRRTLTVSVRLNTRGRVLVDTAGGRRLAVNAVVQPRTGATSFHPRTHSRFVAKTVLVATVHFASSRSNLGRGARAKLTSLRRHLGRVRIVRCVGNTDNRGTVAADEILGLKRAVATCAYITRHRHLSSRVRSDGKTNPVADNTTADGRRKNRRTDITLLY